jgi:hypothetical protein
MIKYIKVSIDQENSDTTNELLMGMNYMSSLMISLGEMIFSELYTIKKGKND